MTCFMRSNVRDLVLLNTLLLVRGRRGLDASFTLNHSRACALECASCLCKGYMVSMGFMTPNVQGLVLLNLLSPARAGTYIWTRFSQDDTRCSYITILEGCH